MPQRKFQSSAQETTVHIKRFITATTIPEAHNILHGIIGPVVDAFAVTPKNICDNGVRCPVQPGDNVVYDVTLQCPAYVAPVCI